MSKKIYLSDILEFLKNSNLFNKYGVGYLNSNTEKYLGIYDRQDRSQEDFYIGEGSKTRKVELLVHGTKNYDETERLADELQEFLKENEYTVIDGKNCLLTLYDGSIDLARDGNGIFERDVYVDIDYDGGNTYGEN